MLTSMMLYPAIYGCMAHYFFFNSTCNLFVVSVLIFEKAESFDPIVHEEAILIIYTHAVLTETQCMQKELVKLFSICHSRMEEIVPANSPVRYFLPLKFLLLLTFYV
jgi:hypothetical protein